MAIQKYENLTAFSFRDETVEELKRIMNLESIGLNSGFAREEILDLVTSFTHQLRNVTLTLAPLQDVEASESSHIIDILESCAKDLQTLTLHGCRSDLRNVFGKHSLPRLRSLTLVNVEGHKPFTVFPADIDVRAPKLKNLTLYMHDGKEVLEEKIKPFIEFAKRRPKRRMVLDLAKFASPVEYVFQNLIVLTDTYEELVRMKATGDQFFVRLGLLSTIEDIMSNFKQFTCKKIELNKEIIIH